jgi:hypothetical protein
MSLILLRVANVDVSSTVSDIADFHMQDTGFACIQLTFLFTYKSVICTNSDAPLCSIEVWSYIFDLLVGDITLMGDGRSLLPLAALFGSKQGEVVKADIVIRVVFQSCIRHVPWLQVGP